MKKIIVMVMMLCSAAIFAAVDFSEAYALRDITSASNDEIYEKIEKYNANIKADKNDTYSYLALGILNWALAVKDEPVKGTGKKAAEYIDKAVKADSKNYIVLTYAGNAHSIVARDDGNVAVKMMETNNGIKYYDKAAELAKGANDEWFVRYNRGMTYLNLPDMFGKKEKGNEDMKFVEKFIETNPGIASDRAVIGVYHYKAENSKSDGKLKIALNYWKKIDDYAKQKGIVNAMTKNARKQIETYSE